MDEILKDERFAHIPRDPAFKRIPRRERKVTIDKRFQSMFSDKNFNVRYSVDKRGRPLRNSSFENLKRYYELESSDETDSSDDDAEDHNESNEKLISDTDKVLEDKISLEDAEEKKKKKTRKKKDTHLKGIDEEKCEKLKKESKKEIDSPLEHSQSKRSNYVLAPPEDSEDDDDGDDGDGNDGGDDDDDNNEFQEVETQEERKSEKHKANKLRAKDCYDKLDKRAQKIDEKVRVRLQDLTVDYARGEGVLLSDSSSDEDSSDEEEDDDEVEHLWGVLDRDAERTDDSTRRLAVCNLDWDRLRAQDLMVLFNSFLPPGGIIHSVTVYPSEYGLQRMKEEQEKGPLELRGNENVVIGDEVGDLKEDKAKKKTKQKDEETIEGDKYQREKLRQYQLNRLRYYYAVIECDSVATADSIYQDCDGMEYESSSARLDLRFIPDDINFDQEPRETCTELPNMTKYEPQYFITTALQQSKVRLTWDETDPWRQKFNEKLNAGRMDEVDERDLKTYVATSSEGESSAEEDEGKQESTSKYRALLETIESQEVQKKEKDMEMQVTWGIDLKQTVERRMKDGKTEELTPFLKYMQKRKEKRKARREEQLKRKQQYKESSGEVPEEDGNVSEDDVPSDIDMNDDYFKEEFDKDEFAHTKKKESNKKKNKKKEAEVPEDEETKRKKAELELLLMDEDDTKKHFSLKDILVDDKKSKKKKKNKRAIEEVSVQKDDFQINLQDDRFSALFTSHLYNIDPADPHYKKTKNMEALRHEKIKRRMYDEEVPTKKQRIDVPEKTQDTELSQLIKNVKRKSQMLKK